MEEVMITFPNTHSAIQGEKVLLEGGLQVGVMPMPTAVSAGCGICLRIAKDSGEKAKELLAGAKVSTDGWYRIMEKDCDTVYNREV